MSNVISFLENQIQESDTTESQIGQQRERNHRYFNLQPLGNERPGRSHYIDPCVFSSVEDKKSVFSETFLSSRQVVRFNGSNHDESEAKNAYVQRVLKDNHYEELFADGWHDAFVAKRMTVWVSWEREREEVVLNFLGAPTAQVNAQVAQLGDIVDVDRTNLRSDLSVSPMGQQQYVHTGTLVLEVETGSIGLDLVQPEYVMRDPNRAYARDALWNAKRVDVSRIELIDMGYEADQVDRLKPDYRWGDFQEDYARKSIDQSSDQIGRANHQQEEVTIYKTRTWMSLEAGDIDGFTPRSGMALYEIHWGHGEVLRWADGTPAVTVLDEMGVYEWSEIKIAHAENGMCTADVEAHQQKAGSGLKRGVMDNMNITNNPRWIARLADLTDPRDLLDNAIGAVVDTERMDAVAPLPQPQLSPMVMGVMEMLDRDSEERSGMSDLARGLNQSAVSNQNADSMIERLTTAGIRRVAMQARSFANTFLIPLLQCIVRYGAKYDQSRDVMESGGKQLMIAPSTWSDDDSMEVEVALTPQEAQSMAQKLLVMGQTIAADEDMKPLYGLAQKHALYDTVYELMGVKDASKFLAPVGGEQHQRAMQAQQQAQQMAAQQAEEQKQWQQWVTDQQLTQGWTALNNKIMDTIEDNELNRDEHELNIFKTTEELRLEEEQERGVAV